MGNAASTEEAAPDPSQASGQSQQQRPHGSLPSSLVICGPSGVGKGTLIKNLMESADTFGFSCSHTTRAPRPGEEDGKHYYFTTKEKFQAGIEKGAFLEHAEVHSNFYGTSAAAVRKVANAGKCCILDIDVQGARQVRQSKLQAIFVCITPPSRDELERRLRDRGTETEAQVQSRLKTAEAELDSVNEAGLYDYIICNEDVGSAGKELKAVAERALKGLVGRPADQPPAAASAASAPEPASKAADPEKEPLVTKQSQSSTPQASSPPRPQLAKPSPSPASPSAAAVPSSPAAGAGSNKAQGAPCPGISEPVMCVAQSAAMARWRGQVALVTGASAGIGWVVCQTLAAAGMRVVAVARRRDRLEALQQDLVASGIAITDFLPIVCDISKEAEVVAVPRIIAKRWPGQGIDVLINNAGLGRDNASLCSGVTSSWVEMISTNVLGLCMFTRAAVQDMRARGQYGHIINISSMGGHRMANAANGGAFYCATKHAVRALTEGLRQEARTAGIPLRVTEVSPGIVDTEFQTVSSYGKSQGSSIEGPLQGADVAHAVLYALSAPPHVEVNDVLMRPVNQPN